MKTKFYIYVSFVLVLAGLISSPLIAQNNHLTCALPGGDQQFDSNNVVQISISNTHRDPEYSNKGGLHMHKHTNLPDPVQASALYEHIHDDPPVYNLHILGIDAFNPHVALAARGRTCIRHVTEPYTVKLPGIEFDKPLRDNQLVHTMLGYSTD